MRFNLLGTLEVVADSGEKIRISRPRARQLLTVLLVLHDRSLSADFLVRAVWGEEASASTVGTLRTHLYLLRCHLTGADRLHRDECGYRFEVRPGELDLEDFRSLAAAGEQALAAGDLRRAENLLRHAMSLWRLPEVRDLPGTPAVMAEIVRLSATRAQASQHLVDAVLRQGRHPELVPELQAGVQINPLNERAWEQLILALYGSGRRAEAIQAYHGARTLLSDEYGIDPGPRLRNLFEQVLRDDPELTSGAA
jgi:DNA-binding SARP family transcriptional activator